jgi:hypothetical protein
MADVRTPWPSPSVEKRLAGDLLAGAPDEVAEAYLTPLTAYLRSAHPASDPEDCATAAEAAILDVCRGLTPYDPSGLPLGAFLRFLALHHLRTDVRPQLVCSLD